MVIVTGLTPMFVFVAAMVTGMDVYTEHLRETISWRRFALAYRLLG